MHCYSPVHYSSSDSVGVVRALPHMKSPYIEVKESPPKKSSCSGSDVSDSPSHRIAPPYKDPPAPPPYRDPPPPTSSEKYKKTILQEANNRKEPEESNNKLHKIEEPVIYNAQYRELVALINYQREKISTQQADLTKVSLNCHLGVLYS